jgi:hypothetical protein
MNSITLIDERGEQMTLEPRLVPCVGGNVQIASDLVRLVWWLATEPNLTPERAAEIVSQTTGETWRAVETEHT